MKLARQQNRSLQECQETNTSSEFVDWQVLIGQILQNEKTKEDHYWAAIIAEIRTFRYGFGNTPKVVDPRECLIGFGTEEQKAEPKAEENKEQPEDTKENSKGIETGLEAVQDPKWAQVNARAKAGWAGFLKMKDVIK